MQRAEVERTIAIASDIRASPMGDAILRRQIDKIAF
jgi:hypothetical protein